MLGYLYVFSPPKRELSSYMQFFLSHRQDPETRTQKNTANTNTTTQEKYLSSNIPLILKLVCFYPKPTVT